MKKFALFIFIFTTLVNGSTPFSKGVNLTGWFQVNSAAQIQFGKYTKQDFLNIKSLGADVIRLPINLHFMTDGAPNYNLDPLFLYFLDSAVTWAEQIDVNLILDNHTFDPLVSTDPSIENVLVPVWRQMAEHYKNRSKLIFYEILNEPNGISRAIWNSTQGNVVRAIREIDSLHTIIVGGTSWNSYNELSYLPNYADTNLIYTFHFYDPFLFTHQGADWTTPSMNLLSAIPFIYSASKMPALPTAYNGTWIQSSYNTYNIDGTIQKVKSLLDIADNFQKQRNVPVYCGELGVFMKNSNNGDRVEWYRLVRQYLEEKGIPWTSWDYQGEFGLFEKGTNELFKYDLNLPLLDALGFNQVPQQDLIIRPDSSNIYIYFDKVHSDVSTENHYNSESLSYNNEENVRDGKFCIYWADANQYDFINLNFVPDKDFSYLISNNFELHISVKGNSPNTKFDIRFIDTKTSDPNDHPWRIRYTINDLNGGPWDNTWHDLVIPLANFREHGSWDNDQWYNAMGEFDWSKIDVMDIVAEEENFYGKKFWFDNIYISNTTVKVNEQNLNFNFNLSQNYPNPFNPNTTITYSLPNIQSTNFSSISNVKLIVYDILGREITTLVDQKQNPGNYEVKFDGSKLSSGVYYYSLKYGDNFQTNKMMLIK